MESFFLHPAALRSYGGLEEEVKAVTDLIGKDRVGSNMALIPPDSVVFPRYRMIPFGKELEREVESLGSQLVNSYAQHRNIADLSNWVELLEGLTPPAFGIEDIPYLPEGEWIMKGETNSKKNSWFESCYAPRTGDLVRLMLSNSSDTVLGSQRLFIRPYQEYRQIATAVDGRPVFNERRVFIYQGEIVSIGDYWVSVPEALGVVARDENSFRSTLDLAVSKTRDLAQFYVIDMAEYEDGHWGVVELNDGTMSGLSANDPSKLWKILVPKT